MKVLGSVLLLALLVAGLGWLSTLVWPVINDVKTGGTPEYPDLHPQRFHQPFDRVFDAALAAARSLGWEVTAVDRERGEIRAVAVTPVLRFRDDVTVSLAREGDGVVVNVRSRSRVGKGDFGANARRIRRFQEALASRLQAGAGRRPRGLQ